MPDWSLPSTLEATSVHHGYATAKATVDDLLKVDAGTWTAADDHLFLRAWYAKLAPGGFILPHTDQGPWMERWHYPISGVGEVWQEWEDGEIETRSVRLAQYRMMHHKPHAVWNPLDEPRVVLIVEYDHAVDEPYRDLEVFDPLPQMEALVRNARQTTRV